MVARARNLAMAAKCLTLGVALLHGVTGVAAAAGGHISRRFSAPEPFRGLTELLTVEEPHAPRSYRKDYSTSDTHHSGEVSLSYDAVLRPDVMSLDHDLR
jgi:hypothetical protein